MIRISTLLLLLFLFVARNGSARKLPEASSTLLRMHRLYIQQPPHDTALYDLLHVSPNATAADLTKSYRKLSRKYHPDKQQRASDTNKNKNDTDRLERIRHAYEILKQDNTRLAYHRYGLMDTVDALYLLRGKQQQQQQSSVASSSEAFQELLLLMGYETVRKDESTNAAASTFAHSFDYHHHSQLSDRAVVVARQLAGLIRPFVEGSVPDAFLADLVAAQCDRLKGLPLGAHIVRCIGRAYRYKGRKALRQQEQKLAAVTNGIRGRWRFVKQVVHAAVASGKVVLSEQQVPKERTNNNNKMESISYHFHENNDNLDDDEDAVAAAPCEDSIRLEERRKAQTALLESQQVEALWQVSKIELDRVIRQACDLVLDGETFFHFSSSNDGWVGHGGVAIPARVGRARAAAALVLLGDIMVQRSKEGTAWME